MNKAKKTNGSMTIQVQDVANATAGIDPDSYYSNDGVVHTPLMYSEPLSRLSNAQVYLKCEHQQTTGSFKIRGATNALLNLSESEREKGVITASTGNHGAATACAAKSLHTLATIYVPDSISPLKESKISGFGAKLVKIAGGPEAAEIAASKAAEKLGKRYISPYNDFTVIAGQGAIGQEILSAMPDLNTVFASVGGGGLISGIGSVIRQNRSEVDIVGCWPEVATSMLQCMRANQFLEVTEQETLSDGTAGGVEPGSITLELCRQVITATETVSELEIAQAMTLIHEYHGFEVEGAAGVAVAAFLKSQKRYIGKKIVIVLCGKNISDEKFQLVLKLAK